MTGTCTKDTTDRAVDTSGCICSNTELPFFNCLQECTVCFAGARWVPSTHDYASVLKQQLLFTREHYIVFHLLPFC